MKTTLLTLSIVLLATCFLSFTDKSHEMCLKEKADYYNTELVVFEGYGVCGLLFTNVNTGLSFRVARKPDDMYVYTGRKYYITRQLFEYSNESCEMYEILTWSPATYY